MEQLQTVVPITDSMRRFTQIAQAAAASWETSPAGDARQERRRKTWCP
jgi:hypothetical protein